MSSDHKGGSKNFFLTIWGVQKNLTSGGSENQKFEGREVRSQKVSPPGG